MKNKILFDNMIVEEMGDLGILIVKPQILIPDKTIVHNSGIILPSKNTINSNLLLGSNGVSIPHIYDIYGGVKNE